MTEYVAHDFGLFVRWYRIQKGKPFAIALQNRPRIRKGQKVTVLVWQNPHASARARRERSRCLVSAQKDGGATSARVLAAEPEYWYKSTVLSTRTVLSTVQVHKK